MSSVVVSMLSPANGAASASQLPNKINNSCFPATGADGKPVEPQVEVKATRFGLDVTEILKRTMLPWIGHLVEHRDHPQLFQQCGSKPARAP